MSPRHRPPTPAGPPDRAALGGARAPGGAWGSGLRPGRSPRQDGRRRVPLSPSHCVRRLWRRRSRRRGAGRSVPLRRRSALHPRSEVHDRRNLRPADRRLRNRRRTLRAGEPRGNHRRGRRPGGRSSRGALRPGLLQLPPAWPWRATAPSWSQKPIGTASARSARPGRPPPRSTASRHLRGSAPRAMGQCSSPTRKPIAWFASSADGRFAQARGDHRHLGWERRRVCASHGVAADGAGLLGVVDRYNNRVQRFAAAGTTPPPAGASPATAVASSVLPPRPRSATLDGTSKPSTSRASGFARVRSLTLAVRAQRFKRFTRLRAQGSLRRDGAASCRGRPALRVLWRGETILRRTALLTSKCRYRVTLRVRAPRHRLLLISARFLGNQRLVPRSAHPVRVGRGG